MELMQAHRQWSDRPADERFWTLDELRDEVVRCRRNSSDTRTDELSADITEKGLILRDGSGKESTPSHWAMGQLCSQIGAPPSYIRTLPDFLAMSLLNHGVNSTPESGTTRNMLYSEREDGDTVCRAITSSKYSRIWNSQLVELLEDIGDLGWQTPPARPIDIDTPGARPATEEDCLGQSQLNIGGAVQPGDMIAPAGLYASDQDMFIFQVNESYQIDDGTDEGLSRGFFLQNSEVGASSLKLTTFLYKGICGNHIVWSASNVSELRIRHVGGNALRRFRRELKPVLRRYLTSASATEEGFIMKARNHQIGGSKQEVLDKLFKLAITSRKNLEDAYEHAETYADQYAASPRSAWGIAQGLTWVSQKVSGGHTNKRVQLDQAAGRIINLAR